MTTIELRKLAVGIYLLEDRLKLHKYNLQVHELEGSKRMYSIWIVGSSTLSSSIYIHEQYVDTDEDEFGEYIEPYYNYTASVSIGSLNLHSDDVYYFLKELTLIN